jgi:hypothetical protein
MKNSRIKLKLILQRQLKNAKGKKKLEIERRLAEIEHPSMKSQVATYSEYSKVFINYYI